MWQIHSFHFITIYEKIYNSIDLFFNGRSVIGPMFKVFKFLLRFLDNALTVEILRNFPQLSVALYLEFLYSNPSEATEACTC